MKAVIVEHRGDAGTYKEVPTPRPAAGELLIRITAAGVNPVDWKSRDSGKERLPFILGQDFAGVVSETGARVTKYREGERVFGITDHGAYAQYTIVTEDERNHPVAKIPDDVGDADAAALPTAGLTALASLEALGVGKGTSFLVTGATGGVGGYAVQMAAARGARVIGTARSSNADLARTLGVDEFIAYDRENVAQAVRAAYPGGVDAVLDLVDDAEVAQIIGSQLQPSRRLFRLPSIRPEYRRTTFGRGDGVRAMFQHHDVVGNGQR